MKHFYLLLALSSFLVSALPAAAQISIDEVNAEQEGVTFRDRLKSIISAWPVTRPSGRRSGRSATTWR